MPRPRFLLQPWPLCRDVVGILWNAVGRNLAPALGSLPHSDGHFTQLGLITVSSTHVAEIPHPNPSPPGRGAKTLILRLLPLAQLGRRGWGVRVIELT
jgi:hypothetical protein